MSLTLHLEQAGGWLGGDYDYYELTIEGRYYLPDRRSRGARRSRARLGSIDGLQRGDNELAVPFFKRYFLGGATNLRGWGRFDVSPLSGSGLPIGGQTHVELLDRAARADLIGKPGRRAVPRRRQRVVDPGTST